ncbi:MAG: DUF3667 domain-containing protein [Deltaproteobacteria bacterium]|nr:MAG: DUF3667 domain-containing protein [Deltaproteobacteria bacterium]
MALPSRTEEDALDDGRTAPGDSGSTCANCGTSLAGRFCAACGQRADPPERLGAFLREWAEEAFGLDGRLARTLGLLFFAPGRLSADYLAGRRARYVGPVRLFLGTNLAVYVVAKASVALREIRELVYGDPSSSAPPKASHDAVAALGPPPADASPFEAALHRVAREHFERLLEDPGAFTDALLEVLPIVQIAMLPLAAAVVAAVWFGRRRGFLAHLLVTTHLQAGILAWLAAVAVIGEFLELVGRDATADALGTVIVVIGTPFYVGVGLHRVYGGSPLGSAVRTALVLGGWLALTCIGAIVAMVVGFFTM